jgi:hypothetical protein
MIYKSISEFVQDIRSRGEYERGYHHDDKTLIRHIYDLNAINQMGKITDDLAKIN